MKVRFFLYVVAFSLMAGCASRNPVELTDVTEPSQEETSDQWICTGVGGSDQWYCAPDELELVKLIREMGVEDLDDLERTTAVDLATSQPEPIPATPLDLEPQTTTPITATTPAVRTSEPEDVQEVEENLEAVTVAVDSDLVDETAQTLPDTGQLAESSPVDGVLSNPPGTWLIQVASFRTSERAGTFLESNPDYRFEKFKVQVNEETFYTLILAETFEDSVSAVETAELLSLNQTTSKPWVRTVRSLKAALIE